MKRWLFPVLLLVSLFVGTAGAAWVFRLELLPHLLYIVGARYEIERIYYEKAEWETFGAITLYNLEIEKSGWKLYADTLIVRFFPYRTVRVASGRLSRHLSSHLPSRHVSEARLSLTTPLRLIRRFMHIDTLEWHYLQLPSLLAASLVKYDTVCSATLYLDSLHKVRGEFFLLRGDSIKFQILPDSLSLDKQSFVAWGALGGSFAFNKEGFRVYVYGRQLRFRHRRLASRVLHYAHVSASITAKVENDTLYVSAEPIDMPLTGRCDLAIHVLSRSFRFLLNIPEQAHDAYIKAFPEGFFTCLGQAKIGGTSSLRLELRYDPALPETLALDIDWRPKDFSILSWAPGCMTIPLPETIAYHPYNSSRTLILGAGMPTYLSFREITPYVLHAVLHSEDGLFFFHQGFQKAHFLSALLENWRCKCFRRGAGTITMQLVRNLFLTREKTLARKIEEILLTAIIERFRLLSKPQMAELYLNIVEWGPEVYGLLEASRFYFGKEPHDLTIPEAIFLGMLLPSPKSYRYFVDSKSGCCLSIYKPHFQKIAYFLVKQNYLSPDSVEAISPEKVCLKAPAWTPSDTVGP
ncbi:MAG: transglycosylase domain-containing protein [Bacteroidia bacterium]|nr:transglycosylase domain-containing protein [Bacteroidia bacterium]